MPNRGTVMTGKRGKVVRVTTSVLRDNDALVRETITIYYRDRVATARKAAERAQGALLDAEAALDTWVERGEWAHPSDPIAIVWAASDDAGRLARRGAGPAVWAGVAAMEEWFTAKGVDVTVLDWPRT
jgi:hypothetical protein